MVSAVAQHAAVGTRADRGRPSPAATRGRQHQSNFTKTELSRRVAYCCPSASATPADTTATRCPSRGVPNRDRRGRRAHLSARTPPTTCTPAWGDGRGLPRPPHPHRSRLPLGALSTTAPFGSGPTLGQLIRVVYDGGRQTVPRDVGPTRRPRQPKSLPASARRTFTWRAGTTTSTPTASVQRLVDGACAALLRMTGSVQTCCTCPTASVAAPTLRTCNQGVAWKPRTSNPSTVPQPLTWRRRKSPRQPTGYVDERDPPTARSPVPPRVHPFSVSPWDGIVVGPPTVEPERRGRVSPSTRSCTPATYASPFRFVARRRRSSSATCTVAPRVGQHRSSPPRR